MMVVGGVKIFLEQLSRPLHHLRKIKKEIDI